MLAAPEIDKRLAQQIFDEVALLLRHRLEAEAPEKDQMAGALLRVFARYCELIIQRLNRAPEKNYLAFLDTLSLARMAPLPAQAPVTFSPVKKPPPAGTAIVVPAHTKLAAAPGPGGGEPVVFETTREIALSDIKLERIAAIDPHADLWSDKSALASEEGAPGEFVFLAQTPVAHEFYIRQDHFFAIPDISRLAIHLKIASGAGPAWGPLDVEWRIPAPKADIVLKAQQDSTLGLTRSGEVIFAGLPEWPEYDLFGRKGRWLACRARQPLAAFESKLAAEGRRDYPIVYSVALSARWQAEESPVTAAYATAVSLDITRDFYPFGERPRFNDVFYVASEAFAKPGSSVALNVTLTNPASGPANRSLPRVTKTGRPVVKWEHWNGKRWAEIDCRDHTAALTENGQVLFTIPASVAAVSVNGEEGYWLRARLVSGNYGDDERIEYSDAGSYRRIASTLAPPSIQSITAASWLSAGPAAAEAIVTHNNFTLDEIESHRSFSPFQRAMEPYKALYLGFKVPPDGSATAAFAERAVDLYCHMLAPTKGPAYLYDESRQALPRLTWQYWNGNGWSDATVSDTTASLMVSGVITLSAGSDAMPWQQSSLGRGLYWLRACWSAGEYGCMPEMTRLIPNTVIASQTFTLEDEILGSSNGKPRQQFSTARRPVLGDLYLEVREPDMPGPEELISIRADYGADAARPITDAQGRVEAVWVRWHEVPNWLSSTHRDRHFLVDRETGQITFGDNIHGRVPPPGANNVQLRRYQTGGGAGGNKPRRVIEQLRATVPYVDKVTNPEPAHGGQDLEDWDSVCERGSRWLRHRDRAVTAEDYEDLAKLASPIVAQAKCYPAQDRALDPLGKGIPRPGMVSVVVVPRGTDSRPQPDLDLLRRVRDFLGARSTPEANLVVLAPEYVRICVDAEVVAQSAYMGASVKTRCEEKLMQFLHPVTGGERGRGWEFGARPRESDLYAQLEAVEGLSYVRSLEIHLEEDRPGLGESGSFLISSGEHRIRLAP